MFWVWWTQCAILISCTCKVVWFCLCPVSIHVYDYKLLFIAASTWQHDYCILPGFCFYPVILPLSVLLNLPWKPFSFQKPFLQSHCPDIKLCVCVCVCMCAHVCVVCVESWKSVHCVCMCAHVCVVCVESWKSVHLKTWRCLRPVWVRRSKYPLLSYISMISWIP